MISTNTGFHDQNMKTETQMQKLQVENFADIPKISKRG
jgi:hypothetical protein